MPTSDKIVFKLGIVKEGAKEPFFRRYVLKRNELSDGNDFVNTLKRHAVMLYNGGTTTDLDCVNMEEYSVVLFYRDQDNDKVMICHDVDIADAAEEIPRVKIFAEVEFIDGNEIKSIPVSIVNDSVKTTQKLCKEESTKATQTPVKQTAEKSTEATSSEVKRSSTKSEIPHVVDAIGDLLICAASAAHAAAGASKKQAKDVTKAAKCISKAAQQVSKDQFKAAQKISKDQLKAAKQVSKDQLKQARDSIRSAAAAGTESVEALKKSVVGETKQAEDPPPSTPRPFIHGRHTCDQCLTTPIIGKRFHATNLPDYDLCEACYGNYKGSEIKFEEIHLDRDVPLQERWHRKFAMHQKLVKEGPRYGRRSGRWAPPPPFPPHHHHGPPPPPHHHNGPPHPPPPFGPPHHHHPPPPFGPHHPHHPFWGLPNHHHHVPPVPPHNPECRPVVDIDKDKNDVTLQEAIKRSLEDMKENKVPEAKEEPKAEPESNEEPQMKEEPNAQEELEPKDTSKIDEESEVNQEFAENESLGHYIEEPSKAETNSEPDIVVAAENLSEESTEVVSINCKDTVVDSVEEAELTTPTKNEKKKSSSPSVKDDSFAKDAFGDVAAFVGETLDRMGEAIEDLNSEYPKEEESGAKIVDGEEEEDDETSNGWSVVSEGEEGKDIARATSALGSALFNSDNNVSTNETNESNDVESSITSDHISSVTSVPSTVRTLNTVPQALLDRWSSQLEQLHEMGFTDDNFSVEILDRLAAANVGVESEDEVSVQQVVEHLVRDW